MGVAGADYGFCRLSSSSDSACSLGTLDANGRGRALVFGRVIEGVTTADIADRTLAIHGPRNDGDGGGLGPRALCGQVALR